MQSFIGDINKSLKD